MISLAASYSACRFVHIAAIMQGFGIALFCECLAPAGLRGALRNSLGATIRIMAWLSLLTSAGILALQAGQMGDGWPQTLSPAIWLAVLNTAFGSVWLWHLAVALLAVLAAGLHTLTAMRHRLLLAALSVLLVSQALVGHSAMYDGMRGALQRGNQILHLFSAAWWLGCLLPLLICLPRLRGVGRNDALHALVRFSRSAHFAVALVIISGLVNTWLVLGQWPLDWASAYQRLLLFKIAAVVLMVVLAITNRYGVVPAMGRQPKGAIRLLTLLTLAELVLGCAVLLLVSIFSTFEP